MPDSGETLRPVPGPVPLSRFWRPIQRMRTVIRSGELIRGWDHGGQITCSDAEQRRELLGLSQSRDRGEADRSRAILLTLRGWTSPEIADAFGVREDTVRLWRSAFMRGGVGTLRATVAPGPAAIEPERALDVAEELLSAPVANRPNWTLPRLASEIEQRSGLRISRS